MKKTMTWTTSNGTKIELIAEYEEKMKNEILSVDGHVIVSRKMVKDVTANLIAMVNGKQHATCWDYKLWKIVDMVGHPYKKIYGIPGIGLTDEKAKEVEEFLKSVIESGKSEEVAKHESEVAEKEKAETIKDAKEIIAKAEKQASIPTVAEYKVWARNYNNLHNEGGDGYVPKLITKEEYEYAKSILA